MGMNRWIVIINKSPRGPLTTHEVRELIQTKHLRYNDLACQIQTENTGEKVEWKFLWQFPDFNRREGLVEESADRREPLPLTHIEKEKNLLLPEELASINPEDLVYHTRMRSGEFSKEEEEEGALARPSHSTPKRGWLYISTASFAILLGVVYFNSFTPTPEEGKTAVKPNAMALPLPEQSNRKISSALPTSPLQERKLEPVAAAKKVEPPKTPEPIADKAPVKEHGDKGEISYDDYRKKKEEQLEKEEEEALSAEQEEGMDEQDYAEEESRPIKKKTKRKAKKRRITSEDDEIDPLDEEGDL